MRNEKEKEGAAGRTVIHTTGTGGKTRKMVPENKYMKMIRNTGENGSII
jgi:hypothetical protein